MLNILESVEHGKLGTVVYGGAGQMISRLKYNLVACETIKTHIRIFVLYFNALSSLVIT